MLRIHAGKVQYDEATNKCTPLPTKGVIMMRPSKEEVGFFNFKWSPRSSTSNIESDRLLIIPGDVTFKHVKSCKTGRVVALTFLSSGAKHLYWLQDVGEGTDDEEELSKLTEKDINFISGINEMILSNDDEEEDEDEEQTAKQGGDYDNGSEDKSQPPREISTGTAIGAQSETSAPSSIRDAATAASSFPVHSISDVLTSDVVENHLSKLSESQLRDLYADYLPENTNPTKGEIIEVIKNGFFKQASEKLSEQLRESNGTGYLLAQTLKYEYQGEGIENFLNGIRSVGKNDAKKEAEDEKMHED